MQTGALVNINKQKTHHLFISFIAKLIPRRKTLKMKQTRPLENLSEHVLRQAKEPLIEKPH